MCYGSRDVGEPDTMRIPLLRQSVVIAIIACSLGCRDSQFGGSRVTLSPANPIPRLYPVHLYRIADDGTVHIDVEGVRHQYGKGDTIPTSQGPLRVLKIDTRAKRVVLKKL